MIHITHSNIRFVLQIQLKNIYKYSYVLKKKESYMMVLVAICIVCNINCKVKSLRTTYVLLSYFPAELVFESINFKVASSSWVESYEYNKF